MSSFFFSINFFRIEKHLFLRKTKRKIDELKTIVSLLDTIIAWAYKHSDPHRPEYRGPGRNRCTATSPRGKDRSCGCRRGPARRDSPPVHLSKAEYCSDAS